MFKALMSGDDMLSLWLVLFIVTGILSGIVTGYFRTRKIQPRGFKWKIFRNKILFATITMTIVGIVMGHLNTWLEEHGWITSNHAPAPWWQVGFEYALYFFLFNTCFYWLHRRMHGEPAYRWVHKLHHKSTSPNVLTTLSVNPLESVMNGGFISIFLTIFTIHDATAALIFPTNIIMGLCVHSGYEFMPNWWNKSRAPKSFIRATFHDQHHRYFTGIFGGYTTIWDRICGTTRPKFETDYERNFSRHSFPALTSCAKETV